MIASLPTYLAPYPGEWLGFYIERLADRYHRTLPEILDHVGIRPDKPKAITWARFMGLDNTARKTFGAFAHMPVSKLKAMQEIRFRTGHRGQWGYCLACLRSDIQAKRTPYWRRSWLDALTLRCPVHRCLLQPIEAKLILQLNNPAKTRSFLISLAEQSIPQESHWIKGLVDRVAPIDSIFASERARVGPQLPLRPIV